MAVYESAVDTLRPAVLEAVLDCLQKLIACRYVRGTVSDLGGKGYAPDPLARMVALICK